MKRPLIVTIIMIPVMSMRIMTNARTSILKKFAMTNRGAKTCVFPLTLKHFTVPALSNDGFDDEVAAHSDHHHDYSHEHEDSDKYLEEVRNDHQGRENMCFPPTLTHFSGLALPNDQFDHEVTAHSDHHHDHSHEYEDHDDRTDKYLGS